MERLSELFMKYGTDKAVSGYAGVYEVLFHGVKPTSLLEVGIGSAESMTGVALENYQPGGSLRAWRDYFETARIFGMDTEPSTQFTEDRIETFLFDSSDGNNKFEHVAGWPGSFDIIIDDGSHNVFAQANTMANLFRFVKPGGYYIVEDILPGNAYALKEMMVEMVGANPWFFHGPFLNMVIIRKIV